VGGAAGWLLLHSSRVLSAHPRPAAGGPSYPSPLPILVAALRRELQPLGQVSAAAAIILFEISGADSPARATSRFPPLPRRRGRITSRAREESSASAAICQDESA